MAICVVCKTNKVGLFNSQSCYIQDDYYEVCSPACVATASDPDYRHQAPEEPKKPEEPEEYVPNAISKFFDSISKFIDWLEEAFKEAFTPKNDLALFGVKLIILMIVAIFVLYYEVIEGIRFNYKIRSFLNILFSSS